MPIRIADSSLADQRYGMMLRRLRFSLWYYFSPPWDTGISPPELMTFLNAHPAGRALDLGCGTGTNAVTMARFGWEVTGIDFAGRAIRQARRKAHQAGLDIRFQQGDVTALDHLAGKFDLILDIGCFHGILPELKEKYIRNLEDFLAPEGTFLLYAMLADESSQNRPGITEVDLDRLNQTLKLMDRVDGQDRAERKSIWVTMVKPDNLHQPG